MKIHFHGIGAAINLDTDNTYFLIEDGENTLQVDCSGGLGLTRKVKSGEITFSNLFVTHKHTDHILGFFHLFRVFSCFNKAGGSGKLHNINIFCSRDVEKTIVDISKSLGGRNIKLIESGNLNFKNIDNLRDINIGEFNIEPINLYSKKIEQFGFLLKYRGKKILFFGDEAVGVLDRKDLDKYKDIDYLIIESVVPEYMAKRSGGDIDTERMCHITSKDAGIIATKLNVRNLILIHTADICSKNRQKILLDDAKSEYNGNIIVPNEGDIVEIN